MKQVRRNMVELTQADTGIPIQGREGRWLVYPVEYKRGNPDPTGADEWQLCVQALCLEEMFVTDIPEGAIYYGEVRRRHRVELTPALHAEVRDAIAEMHRLFERGYTPRVSPKKACSGCSLREICRSDLMTTSSASEYVARVLAEEEAPCLSPALSCLSRARGLKRDGVIRQHRRRHVAPLAGTWIET